MSRSRFPIRAVMSALAVSLPAATSHAQSPEGSTDTSAQSNDSAKVQYATQDDVLGVQRDLENYKFQDARTYNLNTANTVRPLGLSGTFQERANWWEQRQATANGAAAWHKHTDLGVPTAIVGYAGSLYIDYEEGKNLTYFVDFNAAPVPTGAGTTDPLQLLDAYVQYSFLRNLALEDQQLNLIVGQTVLPFGLEPQTTQEFKPTILAAQWVGNLGLASRQVGVVVKGDILPSFLPQVDYGYNYRAPVLQYVLGAFNGNGSNVADDNDAKDLLARVVFTVPSDYNTILRQLAIGGTYFRQWFNLTAAVPGAAAVTDTFTLNGKKHSIVTAAATAASSTIVGLGDKTRWGVDVYYNHQPIGIDYELAYGITDTLQANATVSGANDWRNNRGELKQLGQTLTLFYNWGEQFLKGYRAQGRYDDWWPLSIQPFVRWDRWDPNIDVENNEIDVYTAGVNVFFASTTKVQFNFNRTIRNGSPDASHFQAATRAAYPYRAVNAAQAQIQYGF